MAILDINETKTPLSAYALADSMTDEDDTEELYDGDQDEDEKDELEDEDDDAEDGGTGKNSF